MQWATVGLIGALLLAAYLIIVGVAALVAVAIPAWFPAILAIAAGVLIVVGK